MSPNGPTGPLHTHSTSSAQLVATCGSTHDQSMHNALCWMASFHWPSLSRAFFPRPSLACASNYNSSKQTGKGRTGALEVRAGQARRLVQGDLVHLQQTASQDDRHCQMFAFQASRRRACQSTEHERTRVQRPTGPIGPRGDRFTSSSFVPMSFLRAVTCSPTESAQCLVFPGCRTRIGQTTCSAPAFPGALHASSRPQMSGMPAR